MAPSLTPLEAASDVIKSLPSVSLNEHDASEMNPNASDVQLHGNNNTINMSSSADIRQKKHGNNLFFFLLLIGNLLTSVIVVGVHKQISDLETAAVYKDLCAAASTYTDDKVLRAFNDVKDQFSKTTAEALSQAIATAQDGNRNIIRIQLIKEYDAYLIDGLTTIKRRDLEGIRAMYAYYLSINGNHDVPPRSFMFEQMIAKKQITIIE